ncbi:hypothetical protein KR093_005203 [Drosophila rubida]|uniref:Uncharacterized protein n=1 Tax=Drosophila rubida TaxID=30044 RepID=A0AAD4PIK4_9MUSC|nr:hypothetical protein KR093_005203 [Drosophila rubida]
MKVFLDLLIGLALLLLYVCHKWFKAHNKRLDEQHRNCLEMKKPQPPAEERIGLKKLRLLKATVTAIQAGLLVAESSAYKNLERKEIEKFELVDTIEHINKLADRARKIKAPRIVLISNK